MTNKLIIAKSGYNALTETNPDNLIFSSDYNTLKYATSGNTSITVAGDGTDKSSETTVAHGLGYTPFIAVYVNDFVTGVNNYYLCPYSNVTAAITIKAEAFVDGTNLTLKLRNKSVSTYTANYYYKIFKNNLGL